MIAPITLMSDGVIQSCGFRHARNSPLRSVSMRDFVDVDNVVENAIFELEGYADVWTACEVSRRCPTHRTPPLSPLAHRAFVCVFRETDNSLGWWVRDTFLEAAARLREGWRPPRIRKSRKKGT